jgi:hypothetical protein
MEMGAHAAPTHAARAISGILPWDGQAADPHRSHGDGAWAAAADARLSARELQGERERQALVRAGVVVLTADASGGRAQGSDCSCPARHIPDDVSSECHAVCLTARRATVVERGRNSLLPVYLFARPTCGPFLIYVFDYVKSQFAFK